MQPTLWRDRCYIGGRWHDAGNGARFAIADPADGRTIAEIADGGEADALAAVEAAMAAQDRWGRTTAHERSRLLSRWFDAIIANKDALARLITREQGKILAEAEAEIAYGASYIDWFAQEARRIRGDLLPATAADRRLLVLRQPVGVVAAITPWNFPHAMITRKAAAALAAGCTFIVKPSELTPLSALALAALAEEAELPAGVFNVVTGTDADAIGRVLTVDPRVRKFSFTGSTAVGKRLLAQCASTVKRVSLELGGNAPLLVFADADLDAAVEGAFAAKFRNAGQACVAANRILVERSIAGEFAERLTARAADTRLGRGDAPGVTMGPLISAQAAAKVRALCDNAVKGGAEARVAPAEPGEVGHFVPPTVLTRIPADAELTRAEIFGPLAPIYSFDTEAEAIGLANDTPYGLAGYLYSRDVGRLLRVAEQLEYGMVGANEVAITGETIPFGGIKESGFGREGSRYGLEDYTQLKYICLGGIASAAEAQAR